MKTRGYSYAYKTKWLQHITLLLCVCSVSLRLEQMPAAWQYHRYSLSASCSSSLKLWFIKITWSSHREPTCFFFFFSVGSTIVFLLTCVSFYTHYSRFIRTCSPSLETSGSALEFKINLSGCEQCFGCTAWVCIDAHRCISAFQKVRKKKTKTSKRYFSVS